MLGRMGTQNDTEPRFTSIGSTYGSWFLHGMATKDNDDGLTAAAQAGAAAISSEQKIVMSP